jgi:hypothetical protein
VQLDRPSSFSRITISKQPISTITSIQSMDQHDVWSIQGNPTTSEHGSQHNYYPPRHTGSLHGQNGSDDDSHKQVARRYYQDTDYVDSHTQVAKRYHQDKDYVPNPDDSQREHSRVGGRMRDKALRGEVREALREAAAMDSRDTKYHPRVQRRVTDFPGALPTADFGRRHRGSVDSTDQRRYTDSRERRGRERQPV